MRDDLPSAARCNRRWWRTMLDERRCLLLFFLSSSFSSSFSFPVRPCISFLECPISGAVAAEDGALELLLLEAMKTVVTLVVTLVYCFPWSSLCASFTQDINDGDEDVRCCQLNGSLLPCFCFSACVLPSFPFLSCCLWYYWKTKTQKKTMVDGDGGLNPGDGGSSPVFFLLFFVSMFFFCSLFWVYSGFSVMPSLFPLWPFILWLL